MRYRELLNGFSEHHRTGRLLDIGCGVGYFLEEAGALGWTPYGTEYGEHAVELARAKGFHVVDAATSNAESWVEPGTFDVVTAFEVLEHVVDPALEVALIARALRPGGVFYCTTPNFAALSRRLLRSRWSVIDYPEHLNYFTTRTLTHLLMARGFTVKKIVTSGISLARVGRAVGVTGDHLPEQPSVDERVREAADRSRVLQSGKLAVNALLTTSRTGDSLKAWFQLNSRDVVRN
jgi:SAM-dependent methyltransferase